MQLTKTQQAGIGAALAALMVATRGHHFATLQALPSASWAVFFLAGLYLRPWQAFPAFLALAASLDFAAVTWGGVSNFCTSPAYPFLIPAYGSLWLAGRWYAGRHAMRGSTLLPLAASLLAGATFCELWSSGGFYFLSGRFAEPTFAEFLPRVMRYFPRGLESFGFWIAVAGGVHIAAVLGRPGARAGVGRSA